MSPIVAAGGLPAKILLINFVVAGTTLQLSFAVVLDVVHHCGGNVSAAEGAFCDSQRRAFLQVGTTFLKADFVLAELADESDLVKHIDEVSVQLFWLEYLFALSAIDVCLEPLFDT